MKKIGIWTIIVAAAFIAGTLMANPVANAAGGWKDAIDNFGQTLGTTISCSDGEVLKWNSATSTWDCAADIDTDTNTDTNASTICSDGTFLNGDGTCDAGFLDADGIDSVGIVSETDPQVGSVVNGLWCRGTGTQVTCDQPNPSISGTYSVRITNVQLFGSVNNFDLPVDFRCPPNQVLVGEKSFHDNSREDRQFSFYCGTLVVDIP